eukprot:scaffold397946_cov41-Prasinocladus_malaysianus.AAC.1
MARQWPAIKCWAKLRGQMSFHTRCPPMLFLFIPSPQRLFHVNTSLAQWGPFISKADKLKQFSIAHAAAVLLVI